MEKLPQETSESTNSSVGAESQPVSALNSIISFEDLAETKLTAVANSRKSPLFLFVFVVSAAVATTLLLSGCADLIGKCSYQESNLSAGSFYEADDIGIEVASKYADYRNGEIGEYAKSNLSGYENISISFVNMKYLTNYFEGDSQGLAFNYVKDRKKYSIESPLYTESKFLFYNGDLSSNPFYTDINGLLPAIKPMQELTVGIVTGALTESEKSHCNDTVNLCKILDVYANNKKDVSDFLSPTGVMESTVSVSLPIFFIGTND